MGVKIKVLKGEEITKSVLEDLYRLYLSTIEKIWSYNYLTKEFFINLIAVLCWAKAAFLLALRV